MIDHSQMKLGKRAPAIDRQLRMLSAVTIELDIPAPPAAVSWSTKMRMPYGQMLNDRISDCTCAAKAHAVQCWTANAGGDQITVSDAEVLGLYRGACGYDPRDPATDQGGVMTNVIRYWRAHPLAGHAIVAAAQVSKSNPQSVRDAVWLFGGCDIGVMLPACAQNQNVWNVPAQGPTGDGEPGSWGGHDVYVVDYNERGLACITWGELKWMTWNFWATYVDEAYAYLSRDWCGANKLAPSGFDWSKLIAALNRNPRVASTAPQIMEG